MCGRDKLDDTGPDLPIACGVAHAIRCAYPAVRRDNAVGRPGPTFGSHLPLVRNPACRLRNDPRPCRHGSDSRFEQCGSVGSLSGHDTCFGSCNRSRRFIRTRRAVCSCACACDYVFPRVDCTWARGCPRACGCRCRCRCACACAFDSGGIFGCRRDVSGAS